MVHKMNLKKILPILLILGLSVSAFLLDLDNYLNLEYLKIHYTEIHEFLNANRAISIFIYSLIYVIVVAISLPVATFMTILGGLTFGQILGTVTVVLSATIGACIFFLTVKIASSELINDTKQNFIKKMQKGFQENAFFYLLSLRLMPIFPFVAVNLGAAIFQIPLKVFFLGTLIGIIPGSFVYVSIGVALREVIQKPDFSPSIILDPQILIALLGLGILALLPVIYKRFKAKRH